MEHVSFSVIGRPSNDELVWLQARDMELAKFAEQQPSRAEVLRVHLSSAPEDGAKALSCMRPMFEPLEVFPRSVASKIGCASFIKYRSPHVSLGGTKMDLDFSADCVRENVKSLYMIFVVINY